jgi:hypothetical protein
MNFAGIYFVICIQIVFYLRIKKEGRRVCGNRMSENVHNEINYEHAMQPSSSSFKNTCLLLMLLLYVPEKLNTMREQVP